MSSISNQVGQCIFCGQAKCSSNPRDHAALETSKASGNHIMSLLFEKMCHSLLTAAEKSEFSIQELLVLSTVNKYFMKKSNNLIEKILNIKEVDGKTALITLAKEGKENCVRMMRMCLGAGIPVDATCNFGRTALINAAISAAVDPNKNDWLGIIKTLIDAGADANIRDKVGDGTTALGYIKQLYSNLANDLTYEEKNKIRTIIQMLEQAGATE